MDPKAFDRISRLAGGTSRRKAVAAAGAALGSSLLGTRSSQAKSSNQDEVARRIQVVLNGGFPLSAPDGPTVEKNKKKGKTCERCQDCDCLSNGNYLLGTTDAICILFYPDGSMQDTCINDGLACAKLEANCKNGKACLDRFLANWLRG
jgi:hypothetical protein